MIFVIICKGLRKTGWNYVTNFSRIFLEGFSSVGFQTTTISCFSSSPLLSPLHLQDSTLHPVIIFTSVLSIKSNALPYIPGPDCSSDRSCSSIQRNKTEVSPGLQILRFELAGHQNVLPCPHLCPCLFLFSLV